MPARRCAGDNGEQQTAGEEHLELTPGLPLHGDVSDDAVCGLESRAGSAVRKGIGTVIACTKLVADGRRRNAGRAPNQGSRARVILQARSETHEHRPGTLERHPELRLDPIHPRQCLRHDAHDSEWCRLLLGLAFEVDALIGVGRIPRDLEHRADDACIAIELLLPVAVGQYDHRLGFAVVLFGAEAASERKTGAQAREEFRGDETRQDGFGPGLDYGRRRRDQGRGLDRSHLS